jgi:Tol biopolymer transport system component
VGSRAAVFVVGLAAVGLLAGAAPAKRATFPGPNGQLVYTLSQLYVVNPDGSGKRAVTTSTPARPIRAFQPGWAPDGFRITFANTVGTSVGGGIWIINSDGTGGARVGSTQQNDGWPTFSPDGRQIAFVRRAGRFDSIFVVNTDGSGLRQVTNDVTVEDPEWSPDGTRFTFSNGFDLYVVNADGTGARNLTAGEASNARHPAWSPDGSRLAYAVLNQVRVIPAAGGASSAVVSGLREVWEVSWSPDGTQIAFVNDPGDNIQVQEELYVANADGSNVRRLNVDTETTVDWGKLGAVPPPVAGVSVNVAPVSGTVLVRVRGTNRFVNLARLRNVPVGSELDVTRGRVRLVSAAAKKKTQTGIFYSGRAIVRQPRAKTPVTTLQLSGRLTCPKRSFAAAKPPRTRRLWGNAKGKFKTQGRFATAAVRGTLWLTEDRCDGTLIRVRTGRVEVLDQVRNRRITLRAGQSYLARARR